MTESIAAEFRRLPLSMLRESKLNERHVKDDGKFRELVESVRDKGVLTPLLVRYVPSRMVPGTSLTDPGKFEIAAGHRRFRAAGKAGVAEVPCLIREMSDREFLEVLITENLQREDPHPLDEARGFHHLLGLYSSTPSDDVREIAARVGKDPSYVLQRLKLLDLTEEAQKAFLDGKFGVGHAVLLARLRPRDQKQAMSAMQGYDDWTSAWPVKRLEGWIHEKIHLDLSQAAFPKDDASLTKAPPCADCPRRTGFEPSLFPDVKNHDVCTDPACFSNKVAAFERRQIKELKNKGVAGKALKLTRDDYTWRGGLLSPKHWQPARPGSCPHVAPGVIQDVRDRGQVIAVCAEPGCVVHWRDGDGSRENGFPVQARDPKAEAREREKREIKRMAAGATLWAVLEGVAEKGLTGKAMQLLVIRAYYELDAFCETAVGFLSERWDGWEGMREGCSQAQLVDALGRLGERGLAQALVALLAALEMQEWYGGRLILPDLAAAYGVDRKAKAREAQAERRAQVKAEEKAKKEEEARKKAPSPPPPPGGRGSKKAAVPLAEGPQAAEQRDQALAGAG